MKNNTESETKRKESKSVLPEIQETFSKCKGNKEKSRELENEAILLRPRLRRIKYKITVLIMWMRMFVKWNPAGLNPQIFKSSQQEREEKGL